MTDKVYEFWYNSCIHESAAACISLHKTKKGAEMALDFHKEEQKRFWRKCYPSIKEQMEMPFGMFEEWGVAERDIAE